MRQLTIRRRPLPAVLGGGLVAVSVIAASCVAALTGGHERANSAAPGAPAAHGALAHGHAASLTGTSLPVTLNLPVPGGSGHTAPGAPGAPGGPGPGGGTGASTSARQPSAAGASVPRLVVPDVIAAVPGGVTPADLARLRKLSQVRAVLTISGGRITVNGTRLTVLGASAAALRPWMPPQTAVSQRVWSDFAAGDLITAAVTGY